MRLIPKQLELKITHKVRTGNAKKTRTVDSTLKFLSFKQAEANCEALWDGQVRQVYSQCTLTIGKN